MYIRFLPGSSGAEIKCTVHVALPKRPINLFDLVQQAKCTKSLLYNKYTVTNSGKVITQNSDSTTPVKNNLQNSIENEGNVSLENTDGDASDSDSQRPKVS